MSLQKRLQYARSGDFVGREAQLDLFKRNISARIPEYPFLQIAGQGGVGKTTLLGRFKTLCEEQRVLHTLTDDIEKTAPAAMRRLAELLAKAGHPLKSFAERYQTYLQLQEKIQKEPDRPDTFSQLFSRAAGKSAVVVGRAIPGINIAVDLAGADLVESQVSALSSYLFQKLKNKDDVQLMLEPEAELTPHFIADLNEVARDRQVVLMFDTFEDTGSVLLPWLLKLAEGRYGEVSENLSFVFAGRIFDAHAWLPVQSLLEHCNLEPFTEVETKTYLESHGVTDTVAIEQIYHLSGGLPVFVAMLAAPDTASAGQATRSVVERFLRNIEDPLRRQVALDLALTRRFDKDVLVSLLSVANSQAADELFAWLISMPFVQARGDYWVYHAVVRTQMVAYQRGQSRSEFERLHQTLADYYHEQADRRGRQAAAKWQDRVWWPYHLEATYHGLCAKPADQVTATKIELAELLARRDEAILAWSEALNQAAIDLVDHQGVSQWAGLVKSGLEAISANDMGNAFKLFDTLCRLPTAAEIPIIGATMYFGRALCYAALGKQEEALADYTEAIRLNPTYAAAFNNQGNTYDELNRFEEALADYTEAIRLNPTYATAFNNRGTTYHKLNRFEEALADYTEAIRLNPTDAAFNNRGNTYAKLNRFEEALADYTEAIRLNPTYATAFNNRGTTYHKLNRFEEALADYTEAIRLNPTDAAFNNRGNTYAKLNRFEEALADYTEAIRLNPTDAAFYNRGTTYHKLNRFEEALADYTEAIRLNPTYAAAFYNRGTTYDELNRFEEALADYTEAIRLNPTDAAFNNRGTTYAKLNRFEEALADYAEAIRLNPTYADAFNNRGNTYDELNRFEEALADYTEAIRLNPTDAAAFYNRGTTYHKLNRFEEALADYAEAIRLNPTYASAFYNRGNTYDELNRFEEALADYTEAIRLNPTDAAFNNRGTTYAKLNRFEEALADYTEAIRLNPTDAAFNNRGNTYAKLNRFEEALADYAEAIRLNPTDAAAFYNRGTTYHKLNRFEEALADYAEAIRLNPTDASAFYNLACVHALQNNLTAVLSALRRALELDPADHLALIPTDSDFDLVRNAPGFQALLVEFSGRPADDDP